MRWQRFPMQLLVSHCKVVYKGCRDGGGLLQILFQNVVIRIHISMRGARVVPFHVVPDKLEAWQSDLIKRDVVRRADISDGQRGSAQIFERLQPRVENRPNRLVALQVNSANAPRTIGKR